MQSFQSAVLYDNTNGAIPSHARQQIVLTKMILRSLDTCIIRVLKSGMTMLIYDRNTMDERKSLKWFFSSMPTNPFRFRGRKMNLFMQYRPIETESVSIFLHLLADIYPKTANTTIARRTAKKIPRKPIPPPLLLFMVHLLLDLKL